MLFSRSAIASVVARDMAASRSAGVAPEIQTGTQDVNMSVSVTYEIR